MSRPYAKVLRRFENEGSAAVADPVDYDNTSGGERATTEEQHRPAKAKRRRRRNRRSPDGSDAAPAVASGGEVGLPASPLARVVLEEGAAPSLLAPRGPNQAQLRRSGLLDVLRTVDPRHSCPCVVIVGVSGVEDLSSLALGLARQAQANGLGFLHARATSGPRGRSVDILENTSESADERYAIGTLEQWNQESPGRPSRGREFDQWLQEASRHHDLILVEGPSLDQSLEAALLGSHCDGLLLAAEVDRTHRAALALASERAAASGCHLLGIVLTETKRWLPRWLERLLDEMMP